MSLAQELVHNFREFIGPFDLQQADVMSYDDDLLADYILAWLEYGDAVIESGGDFGVYMEGVAAIINCWLHDPSIVDFKGSPDKQPCQRRPPHLWLDPIEHRELGEALAFQQSYFRVVLMRRVINRVGV